MLHFPIILLFNQFLENYVQELKNIKNVVKHYETEDGFIKEEFIHHDVMNGITKVEKETHDIVKSINEDLYKVNDLVAAIPIKTINFDAHISSAKRQIRKTIEDINQLDQSSTVKLEDPGKDLTNIHQLIGKMKVWSKSGIFLSKKEIRMIEDYFLNTDAIKEMVDSAIELSVEQGNSTFIGDIASWMDTLGKGTGALDVVKGALAIGVLSSGALKLEKKGKGIFKVVVSSKWRKAANGKFESKLAERIYSILKKADPNSSSPLKRYLSKYSKAPGGVLKEIVGLAPNTKRIYFGRILRQYTNSVVFDKSMLNNYKMKVNVGRTTSQFTDATKLSAFAKRIPVAGITISLTMNTSEFFSDENKYKSGFEKTGRFVAGVGLDAGVAGLTTGGAVIGTMICPGVGTIIGGAVGAGSGIIGSWFAEDKVKEWGESVGRWVERRIEDTNDLIKETTNKISKKLSGAKKFISSYFR